MSKLTPPAMQNLDKRLRFFLDHPEYPGAKAGIQQCRRHMSARGKPSVRRFVTAKASLAPVKHEPTKTKIEKKGFFARIFNRQKKGS